MEVTLRQEDFEKMPTDLKSLLSNFIVTQLSDRDASSNLELIDEKSSRLELVFPHVIPIEAACAIVDGLNEASSKILNALIFPKTETGEDWHDGESYQITKVYQPDRNSLAELLGGPGAINGTIGSINRRFAHRFDPEIFDIEKGYPSLIHNHRAQYFLENGVETPRFNYEDSSAIPFRIAIWFRHRGLSLENGDLSLTLRKRGKKVNVRLNSRAYREFNESRGYIDRYNCKKDEIDPEWQNVPIIMCSNEPCVSIQTTEGSSNLIEIGPATFGETLGDISVTIKETVITQFLYESDLDVSTPTEKVKPTTLTRRSARPRAKR